MIILLWKLVQMTMIQVTLFSQLATVFVLFPVYRFIILVSARIQDVCIFMYCVANTGIEPGNVSIGRQ